MFASHCPVSYISIKTIFQLFQVNRLEPTALPPKHPSIGLLALRRYPQIITRLHMKMSIKPAIKDSIPISQTLSRKVQMTLTKKSGGRDLQDFHDRFPSKMVVVLSQSCKRTFSIVVYLQVNNILTCCKV